MIASFPSHPWLWSLFDAGARSLLMATAVGACLHLLRVSNVRARKVAWMLVLSGAMMMPFVAPWAESQSWLQTGAVVVPVRTWLEHVPSRIQALKPGKTAAATRVDSMRLDAGAGENAQPIIVEQPANPATLTSDHFPSPTTAVDRQVPAIADSPAANPERRNLPWGEIALLLYLAISVTLAIRIALGCVAAFQLWMEGEPVDGFSEKPGAEMNVRSSRAVSSPVTIGSGILLPADYTSWDTEKLRIVLAHESSHVRQGDFYLQLFAALYAAVFWFSPLGWWLKRTLCDLSEAISDGAAVNEAASHVSYAQVLLEFAAMPRTTRIGVAMARTGRLSHRIERLLDESSFRRAFAGGRGRMLIAALLAPLALFAATSLIRVQAAGQAPPPPAAPATPTAPADAAAPAEIPPPPDEPEPAIVAPLGHVAPPAPEMPSPPEGSGVGQGVGAGKSESYSISSSQSDSKSNTSHGSGSSTSSKGQHYSYWYSDDGDSYALVSGNDKDHVRFSGDWMEGRREELDKARRMAHGDFLWFTHDGKSYVVDDPAIVGELVALYKPMDELGRQQEELGRQQEELGRQQEKMGERMSQATVPTPDIAKEMADLNAAITELNAAKGKTVTQEQLADLQGKLAEVQGKLGSVQGEIGARQGEIGAEQGKLGTEQGQLGAQQGRLGAEQGRIARDADRKVKSIIDQSLKDGKARPVQ
jgi:hypothetical protein